MKHYNKLLLFALVAGTFVACADEEIATFQTEKPESMVKYEYLNAYDALKSYVDRSANPNFKLGSGITESDFISKGLVYSLACANYDELTPGNSMKYSSVVKDNGSMDFSTVTKFVDAAKGAGLSIYGHTLCWHAQQNLKYLNGLIAPIVIPGEAGDGGYCLKLFNDAAQANIYAAQTWYKLAAPLVEGKEYTLTCMAKATEAYKTELYLQSSTGGAQGYPGGIDIKTEWTEVTFKFKPSHNQVDKIAFNFGTLAGAIYLDNIKLVSSDSDDNLIDNSDFESGNINSWTGWTPGKYETISKDGEGYSSGASGEGYCLNFTNTVKKSNNWDAQAWYLFSSPLKQGTEYTFTCMIKATSAYNESMFLQSSTGGAQGYPGGFSIGLEWAEVSLKFTPSHAQVDKLTFNFGDFEGVISVDNVKLTASGSDENLIPNGDFKNTDISGWNSYSNYQSLSEDGKGYTPGGGDQIVEKTPAEKKEILTNALENWIKGMLEACDGYVKAWDAVNEPMSDGNTSELKYSTNVSADDAKKNFYWQDYLGKDYARDVVKFARQYGGDGMKLFINDYNLEAAYNSNKKCEGLIKMIEYWESDGVTKIDGIGTQMHVTYSMNPETQKKNEAAVVNMLNLLKATGKLIKISELDMGIADANGTNLKTAIVTFEQQKLMSDYYKFIVNKYFEIIPVAQRYGITHWSPSDSPDTDNSFWRKGEPIGLWDVNYNRKPAYAGYAEGLISK